MKKMEDEQRSNVETSGKQQEKKEGSGRRLEKAQKIAKKGVSVVKKFTFLLPVATIIFIVLLLIGLIAFFITMPGLFLENIKETAKEIWTSFLNVVDGGSSVDRTITEEQEIELAQRIHAMGYDITGMGFANVIEENENGAPTKIQANVEGKNYLRTYLIANESTYALANWSITGAVQSYLQNFINMFFDPNNIDAQANDYSQGLIAIVEDDLGTKLLALGNNYNIHIDREKEALVIEPRGLMKIFSGTFYFNLSDWTSRYGKPVELLLSLHLATMMPDLSYDIVREFNTKVNIKLQPVSVTFNVKYRTDSGEVLESDDIKDIQNAIEESKKNQSRPLPGVGEEEPEEQPEDQEQEEIGLEDTALAELAGKEDIFNELIKLVDDGKRGDITFWPRISSVTEHWFYNTIEFNDVYEQGSKSTINMSYTPEGDDDVLTEIQDKISLQATINNGFIQIKEPVAEGPNDKIKNIFLNNAYYRYDGTMQRAQEIENAKAKDSGKSEYNFRGQTYDVQEKTVEKEPVNFHTITTMPDGTEIKSTKDALSAFSLLEGMHTEASEQIYRNLQELLIELGYFTEEDFATPSTQVLEWILPDHIPDMWAIRMPNEYGAFIRSEANLEGGFSSGSKVISPADATITEITDNSIKLKLKAIDNETLAALQATLQEEDENVTLDPNCILDMEFLIQGIDAKDGLAGDVKRGDEIGTTTNEDIHIIMYNIDKSIVDNVEDYMEPNYKAYGSAQAGPWFNPDYDMKIKDIHKDIYRRLKSYNLTDEAAFAVLGVMMAESSFNIDVENSLGDGGYGLLQWTGGRRTKLENFCRENGYNVASVEGQLEFFIYELEKDYSNKNGYGYPVYETLMTSHDMEECLQMFFSHAEAGTNIPISIDYIYNHKLNISTQELYDQRLTYTVAFAKKQSELEE